MKFRFIALLVVLPALIAGALVSAPAEAATPKTSISTKYVTLSSISDTGVGGVVSVSCKGSARCQGTLHFEGSSNRKRSYSMKGNSRASISVTMNKSSASNPANGTPRGRDGQYKAVSGVNLVIDESAPANLLPRNHVVTTETRSDGRIYYDLNGNFTGLSDVTIELHKAIRGGNTQYVTSRTLTGNGSSGYFRAKLGTNNVPGTLYKMRLKAITSDNERVEWWWRGTSGDTDGGSRYLREANSVYSTKDGFDADVYFGTISGNSPVGADVKVLAPPMSFGGGSVVLRELDVPSCANVFGEVTSDGNYSIPFLPYDGDDLDRRYMVASKVSGRSTWFGTSDPHGSCHSLLDYSYSRSDLIPLNGLNYPKDVTAQAVRKLTTVKAKYSGFSPTYFDRFVRIREKVPGRAVLDTPVVDEGTAGTDLEKSFNLPYGQYWVEVGRRTGCSSWYPSRFSNNDAYFNGADRGAERWKTVAGKYAEYQKSYDMGYVAKSPPSGYAGWMYREFCKAYGEGTYNSLTVSPTSSATKTTSTNDKGAIVRGHVSRSGGRTNKEMLVRLSSAGGTLVLRTAYTNGSGDFSIAGLASGTYTISVNSDSWRGITRSFDGRHSITVTRGNTYNVGTLAFNG